MRVVEVIPPAVNTDLGGPGLHTFGAPLDAFADAVVSRLGAGELEIAYGTAEERALAARAAFDEAFARMNGAPPRCTAALARRAEPPRGAAGPAQPSPASGGVPPAPSRGVARSVRNVIE